METKVDSSDGRAEEVEEIEKESDINETAPPTSLKDIAPPITASVSAATSPETIEIPPAHDLEKQAESTAGLPTDDLLVHWDGEDDPEDPHNWPMRKKWTIMLLVSCSGLVTLMSGTMMAPALSEIAHDLDLDDAAAQLALSIYVLSYALGPLTLAPFSEIIGRRPIWLFCGCFYVLWNTVCGFAHTNGVMIASRWLAGIGASAEFAVTMPVIADTWKPEQRGRGYSLSSAISLLGTAIGPLVGGVVTQSLGWHWLFWVVSIFAGANTLAGFFLFPETYSPVLLTRKARHLRKATGRDFYSEFERSTTSIRSKLQTNFSRPFRILFTHPIVQAVSILAAYNFGVNYIMLSTFAELWTGWYGQSVGQSGLNYIALAIGNTLAAQIGSRFLDRIFLHLKAKNNGATFPEYRVPMLIPGSLLLPIGLFWYGWAGEARAYWLVTDIGVCVFTCGFILSGQALAAYIVDCYPQTQVASAYAASQLMRSLAAFAFPTFAPQMYQTLGYGWGNSVLGFLSCAIGLPAPLLLWKYGPALRAKGKQIR